jgi:hypothetical protein
VHSFGSYGFDPRESTVEYLWELIDSDDNIDGWWSSCDECDPYYEEIKQSGLEALENDL